MKTTPSCELRPIPGLPRYQAGSDGHIYSLQSDRGQRPMPIKLFEHHDKDGYMIVTTQVNLNRKQRRVHQLIAEAFIGHRPAGQEVRHRNGIKSDNHPENLLYGTQLDNARDRDNHGRTARGQRMGGAVLKDEQVMIIKARLQAGELQKHLASEFGTHKTTIQAIASGRNWKWLQAQA